MAAVTAGAAAAVGGAVIGANASKDAARSQANSAASAQASNDAALAQSRADRQPFADLGTSAINPLSDLLNNSEPVTENSTFQSIFGNATRSANASNVSRGKLHSGDTLTDLVKNSAGVAQSVQDSEFNRLFNTVSLGSNAAAGQATSTLNNAANNSALITGAANATAAGTIGQANAINNGLSGLAGIAQTFPQG